MFEKQVALVADSDKQGAQTVARFLKDTLRFGAVMTSMNGNEAFEYIRSEKINWVISDLELHGMSGMELLRSIRDDDKSANTPFIMLSATTDRESLIEALSAGVSDYVAKPFTQATLKEKIERLQIQHEKRIAPRVRLTGHYEGKIIFSPEQAFIGEVINISTSGICVRSRVLAGAMVYDRADMELTLDGGESIEVVVELVNVEAERDKSLPQGQFVRAGYRFINLSDDAQKSINRFVNRHRVKEIQRKTANRP